MAESADALLKSPLRDRHFGVLPTHPERHREDRLGVYLPSQRPDGARDARLPLPTVDAVQLRLHRACISRAHAMRAFP